MNELANLVQVLMARGFVFDSKRGKEPIWVMGGTSVRTAGDGIYVFENAFIIECDRGQWTLRTDGPGQLVNEQLAGTVEDVIELVTTRFGPHLARGQDSAD